MPPAQSDPRTRRSSVPCEPQTVGASGIYRVLISCNDVLPLRALRKTASHFAANPPDPEVCPAAIFPPRRPEIAQRDPMPIAQIGGLGQAGSYRRAIKDPRYPLLKALKSLPFHH